MQWRILRSHVSAQRQEEPLLGTGSPAPTESLAIAVLMRSVTKVDALSGGGTGRVVAANMEATEHASFAKPREQIFPRRNTLMSHVLAQRQEEALPGMVSAAQMAFLATVRTIRCAIKAPASLSGGGTGSVVATSRDVRVHAEFIQR